MNIVKIVQMPWKLSVQDGVAFMSHPYWVQIEVEVEVELSLRLRQILIWGWVWDWGGSWDVVDLELN